MAAPKPMGALSPAPIATINNVPVMALPKPPSDSNGGGGSSVKAAKSRRDAPLEIRLNRIELKAKMAIAVPTQTPRFKSKDPIFRLV